jgi:hypothetical protein
MQTSKFFYFFGFYGIGERDLVIKRNYLITKARIFWDWDFVTTVNLNEDPSSGSMYILKLQTFVFLQIF